MNLFYSLLTTLILLSKSYVSQHVIIDTNLDILFILDQEKWKLEMKGSELDPERCPWIDRDSDFCIGLQDVTETFCNYKNAYAGITAWVNSYFDKADSEKTRFAVIYSCNRKVGGVMHHFRDGNFKTKITRLLEGGESGMSPSCRKNYEWTLQLANDEVFTESRKNATSIVIFVSDCNAIQNYFWQNVTQTAFEQFFQRFKGQVYFVCYDYKSPFKESYKYYAEIFTSMTYPSLRKNNQSDRSMIRLYENAVDVAQNLDYLLPKRSGVSELDCKQVFDCTNYTTPNGTKQCFQSCRWKIVQKPTENGNNCTLSEDPVETWIPCATGTPQPTVPPSRYPLYLGILCALLAIIALLIVAVFFARRKERKRTKERALASRAKMASKSQTIEADMSTMEPKRTVNSVGSKVNVDDKIGPVAKSVSRRSVISAGSKVAGQSSLIKSFSKNSSVSKAPKSINKPMKDSSQEKIDENC